MKFVLSDKLHQSQQAKAIGNRGYTNFRPPSRTNVNSVANLRTIQVLFV